MLTFRRNPYIYGSGAEKTNTPAITLDALNSDGSKLVLDSSHEPLQASINTGLPGTNQQTISISTQTRAIQSFRIDDLNSAFRLTFNLPVEERGFTIIANLNRPPTTTDNIFSLAINSEGNNMQTSSNIVYSRTGNITSIFIPSGALSNTGELKVSIQAKSKGNLFQDV